MEIEGVIIDKQPEPSSLPTSAGDNGNNNDNNGSSVTASGPLAVDGKSRKAARSKSTLKNQPSPLSKKYPSHDLLAVSSYDLHKLSQSEMDGSDSDTDLEDEEDDVIVELCNIHKTYLLGIEGVPALRGVSMEIMRGQFVVVFGTSYAKHTFAKQALILILNWVNLFRNLNV